MTITLTLSHFIVSIAANHSTFGGIFPLFIVAFCLSEHNHAFPLFNTVTDASFYGHHFAVTDY